MKIRRAAAAALAALAAAGCSGRGGARDGDAGMIAVAGDITAEVRVPSSEPRSAGSYRLDVAAPGGRARRIEADRDGTVTGLFLADLAGDSLPEVVVTVASAGSGSYGSVDVYAIGDTGLEQLPVAPPGETERDGYMGHDTFRVEGGTLRRSYPRYREGDSNARPGGGTAGYLYSFEMGAWLPDAPPGGLPATFTGVLPCADCEGIRYHLDLFDDGLFFLRTVYLGRPGDPFDDIGLWESPPGGGTLALHGGRDRPLRFSMEESGALRLLDREGEAIVSHLPYEIARSPDFDPVEPRLELRGGYRYMADAATFTECRTGRVFPVLMEGDQAALERGYIEARREPGEALLVAVEGRIVRRMPVEGPGPVPSLLPEKFLGVRPGDPCAPRRVPGASRRRPER